MNKQPTIELKIDTIVNQLTESDKAKFFDVFWKAWSVNGFGTLTKKDTELLIFGCLKRAFGSFAPRNNYEWAKLLRLTPAKIKSMRLEAHLRFGHLLDESTKADTERFINNFSSLQSIDLNGLKSTGDIKDVSVSFVVEDPVIQMELENRLKNAGSYLDFHRNREVITMRLIGFFHIVSNEEQRKAIDKWVAEKAKETSETDGLKKRVTAKEYSNLTEAGKLMTFVDDLAAFIQVKPLTDHLKKIFASRSERKK